MEEVRLTEAPQHLRQVLKVQMAPLDQEDVHEVPPNGVGEEAQVHKACISSQRSIEYDRNMRTIDSLTHIMKLEANWNSKPSSSSMRCWIGTCH